MFYYAIAINAIVVIIENIYAFYVNKIPAQSAF